jgi:flavin reductase (DIM6/NTAB) family NADH-FMN oxidoreductase RutF
MLQKTTATFTPKELRNALGHFATGITVITAQSETGEKVGVTVNSFNSLSIDPALILWSLDKRAKSYDIFSSAEYFAVNILASDQMDLSNHFATQQKDKFAGLHYNKGLGDTPLLNESAANFQCCVKQIIDAGDHWLFIGKVEGFNSYNKPPLCYYKGSYSMLTPHPGVQKPKSKNALDKKTTEAQLDNNILYLMLNAVQSYQQSYTPQQEALGLNSLAARIIMNISDKKSLSINTLANILLAPEVDINANTQSLLSDGFLISQDDENFILSEKGQQQATQYWTLVTSFQDKLLSQYSREEIAAYKKILRGISQL